MIIDLYARDFLSYKHFKKKRRRLFMPFPALLLIDMQTGFHSPVWGARNNPQSEVAGVKLLAAWRQSGHQVFHAQHLSQESHSVLRHDRPGSAFIPAFMPLATEPVFQKQVNSAFIGTGLDSALRENQITDLVIFGYTTPHCVSTTTRMAANLGYRVMIAGDATASFASNGRTDFPGSTLSHGVDPELIHQFALAHLHGEFADVMTVEMILQKMGDMT
jgi:nicotinamidase-related amidase